MATNKVFGQTLSIGSTPEQNLNEDLTIELIQLAGNDFYYIPRTVFNEDKVLNEDVNSKFETYYVIEMYMQNTTDWGGQGDFLGKFGLEVNDTVELVIARKRFNQETGLFNPKEGDLIFFPLSKSLFQIDFVEFENPFYNLGKLHTFLLKCSLYTFSYERFDTGIDDVDTDLNLDTFSDPLADNSIFNEEGLENMDFSENNPFGEIVED